MERSLFFNSAPGDTRLYQASDFAEYFGSVLSTGLLHTDNIPGMSVSVQAGTLNTVVSPGKAIMLGKLYKNTSNLTLTHSIPEASLSRIDRIVLRHDLRNATRDINLAVKEGTPASSPVAPELQRDNFIYELSLARILVRANTSQLQQSDLMDERLNESLCGLVHSLISIPTEQFQRQWDAFIASAQNQGFATPSFVDERVSVGDIGITTNSGNRYSLTTKSGKPTALVLGTTVKAKLNIANTGTPFLNVNGLGDKEIRKGNGTQILGPLLKPSIYTFTYDGTAFILQGEGGEYGTAVASDVRSTRTIGTVDGIVQGTLDLSQLVASNIRSGAVIGGVAGNITPLRQASGSGGVYKQANYTATKVDIYGLSFRPRIIIFGYPGSGRDTAGTSATMFLDGVKQDIWSGSGGSGFGYPSSIDSVYSGGFVANIGSNGIDSSTYYVTYSWWACE